MFDYEHLFAGLAGGFAGVLLVHPLDLLKVRLQVDDGNRTIRPGYNGYVDLGRKIIRTRGFIGLYQGITPNLVGSTVAYGSFFPIYNELKTYMSVHDILHSGTARNLVASFSASITTLLLTNPIWVSKTRLCIQYEEHHRKYNGFLHALLVTFREEGIRGLYKGTIPGIIGASHGAIQLVTYEELKTYYCIANGLPMDHQLSPVVYLSLSSLSKICAVVTTYPCQVVRSRLQDFHVNYSGVWDVIVQLYMKEHLRSFYKGMLANLFRVTPSSAITFVVYEEVRYLLQMAKKQ